MIESLDENARPQDYLMPLVLTALQQGELSGLSEMLKRISETVQAYGCILWEMAPSSNLKSNPPRGRLFALVEWFEDGSVIAAKHDMPLTESVNGAVIISQTPENIPDIRQDQRAYSKSNKFVIDKLNLQTMCAVPVSFSDSKNSKGTVSLYRNTPDPFTDEEFARVQKMALLIPELYQAIRDKVSRKLIDRVNATLHKADLQASGALLSKDEMKEVLRKVCVQVAKSFQCIETSIFMEDRFDAPDEYRLVGTTWRYRIKKNSYFARADEGMTGWVLANNRPVRIFSLDDFERDQGIIQTEYPGLTWKDSLDIKVSIRKRRDLEQNTPLSFMAAPIFRGQKVLGVIRCCAANNVPYYFADRELNLLKLVAVQISRFWSNWLIRREIEEEKRAWQALVNGVSQLNSFVQKELKENEPNERRIFNETLNVAHDVVTGADILDVRLYDAPTRELHFAARYGNAWKEGSPAEVKARLEKRFSVEEDSPDSSTIGVQVYHSGKAMGIFDAESEGYVSKTFPQTKRIIVAPIDVQDKVAGVLDLRGTGRQDFPTYAIKVAELLGQQLGLYYYLATAIGGLNQAETERGRREKERMQTNEDLAHQLKSPIIQAHARIQAVLSDDKISNERRNAQSLAVRGLIGKAKRVTMSTGIFAELAREDAIQVKPKSLQRLSYDSLVRMLIESAMDNEVIIEPARRVKFHVARASFELLNIHNVQVDPDLLEQAISSLLDNAGKYSFSRTTVEISGGLTKGQSFYVSVVNKGLPIKQHEINLCKQRLWRSVPATWTTGEGSGIGLWVVDHIMKAHKGELLVTSTTQEGVTQIRLIFPVVK